jgi:predicted AAA+ superfamily ATPase
MTYLRKIEPLVMEELESPRIIILTGMRQTGKTTLMRRVFDSIQGNKVFLDLENPMNQKIFEEDNYDNILFNLKEMGINTAERSWIFLDEIQAAPEISKPIKYLHDHFNIKFLLTGSSSYYLKNLFPESLAGRKTVFELFPLDFEEYLVFQEIKADFQPDLPLKAKNKSQVRYGLYGKYYDEYLKYGGFPAVALEKRNKAGIIDDIFKSFFEKDVKSLADFRDLGKLRDVIMLLASRIGSKIDFTKMASEAGISRETVYSYLSFLEKTFFIQLIKPFSGSANGEVRGARKVYLCDPGIANHLGKVSGGALFENAVYLNLRKFGELKYYEKYRGPEIDFIVGGRIAVEVKTSGDERDLSRLRKTASQLKLGECYLVTKNYFDNPGAIQATDL